MNKKHLWGILVVLAISAFVLYSDLKTTPINELVKAAQNINIVAFDYGNRVMNFLNNVAL